MSYYSPRYITQEGHKLEVAPRPPEALTNAVSWRGQGIKYRKNEVFLDVIESVNLLVITFTIHICIGYTWYCRVAKNISNLHQLISKRTKMNLVASEGSKTLGTRLN
jgi:hypothetical protein